MRRELTRSLIDVFRTRVTVALLCAFIFGPAVASPDRLSGLSEADELLNRPLPADPLELLGSARGLSAAGRYDDAASVTRLAERGALLAITGHAPPVGGTVREALRAAATAEPPIDQLRRDALSRVRIRVPSGLANGSVTSAVPEAAPALSPAGGEWTTHLLIEGEALRVPTEVKFEAAVGAIGGLAGQLRLVPQGAGREIVLALNERDLPGNRFGHGAAFWVAPRVVSPRPLSESQLQVALNGLASGRYRLQVELRVAWLTPSDDPQAPFLVISPGRGAIVDDRYSRIPDPSAGRARDGSSLGQVNVPARCAAIALDRIPPPRKTEPSRRAEEDRAPLPLTSPLMRSVFARPMAADIGVLLDTGALFSVARHPDLAERLQRIAERTELVAVLGERVIPDGTIEKALAAPPPSDAELAVLRECVMRAAVGIDLVNTDSTHGVDFFGRPYVREAPRAVDRDGLQVAVSVPLEITNRSAALLTQFEFTVQLTPVAGGEPVSLRIDHSAGSALRENERANVDAGVQPGGRRIDSAALDAIIAATRRGEYQATVRDWSLAYGGEPRFRMSPGFFEWLEPVDREVKATGIIAAASCADTASCTTARSGRGLSSATTWVVFELLAAVAIPFAISRRRTASRGFLLLYAIYTMAALGAALLLRVDPPSGNGLNGILSVGAAFILSLPWTLPFSQSSTLIAALRSVFLDTDAGIVEMWIGIAINHAVLGTLMFRRGPTADRDAINTGAR